MTIKVSEIFHSIQGEGISAGRPAVFLRTALCNLTCTWCDTKYTWDWKNYDYAKEVREMEVSEIYNKISKYKTKRMILTGGEPLLQQKQLEPLMKMLKDDQYFIEVETNGTIMPSDALDQLIDQWNVSPKLANSENSPRLREKARCYEYFKKKPNACFKYVIGRYSDIDEVKSLTAKYELPTEKIILMPEATTRNDLIEQGKWVSRFASENGFMYSDRLHVILWDGQRGR